MFKKAKQRGKVVCPFLTPIFRPIKLKVMVKPYDCFEEYTFLKKFSFCKAY